MTAVICRSEQCADELAQQNDKLHAINAKLLATLVQAIEACGYSISGPTDSRAAEHGEPAWVCNARAAIAKAKG